MYRGGWLLPAFALSLSIVYAVALLLSLLCIEEDGCCLHLLSRSLCCVCCCSLALSVVYGGGWLLPAVAVLMIHKRSGAQEAGEEGD